MPKTLKCAGNNVLESTRGHADIELSPYSGGWSNALVENVTWNYVAQKRCSKGILIRDHDHAHHGINVQPKQRRKHPVTRNRDPDNHEPSLPTRKTEEKSKARLNLKLLRRVLAGLASLLGQQVWRGNR